MFGSLNFTVHTGLVDEGTASELRDSNTILNLHVKYTADQFHTRWGDSATFQEIFLKLMASSGMQLTQSCLATSIQHLGHVSCFRLVLQH